MRPILPYYGSARIPTIDENPDIRLHCPIERNISNALTARHTDIRNKICSLIRKCPGINFTMYIWTSQQMEAYMTMTAHWINSHWEMESFMFGLNQWMRVAQQCILHRHLEKWQMPFRFLRRKELQLCATMQATWSCAPRHDKKSPLRGESWCALCWAHIPAALNQDPLCCTVGAGRQLV